MLRPSTLGSTVYSRVTLSCSILAQNSASSSSENTSLRLSRGTGWLTGAKLESTWPPTRRVGEVGSSSSGWAASRISSLRSSASYSASVMVGASSS